MIRSRKKNILLKLALAILVVIPIVANSQEIQSYSGAKQIGRFQGKTDYTYKVVEGDTILDGSFQMQRSSLEALLKGEDISFLFKGSFEEGFPNGYWQFQFGEFESDSASEVVDYQYRVSVSGTQEEANGFIKSGKPDGQWTYTINRIKDSEVEKTLFESTITFDNGTPQRNFRIENENSTLVGRFLRNGLAHDEWSLYTTDGIGASESWSFDNGILQKIQFDESEKIRVIPVFESTISQTKMINLDARYISTLALQRIPDDTTKILSGDMPLLLAENAKYYQKIDAILSELGNSAFLPEFKVKVPHFPLDSMEKVQKEAIKVHFKKSKAISDSLLNNSQLNILKLSDGESLFLYSIAKTISENFLNPLAKIVEFDERDILEFVARDQLMENLWPQGRPSTEIKAGKETDSLDVERTFVLSGAERYDFKGNTIESAREIAKYAAFSLDSIQQVFEDKLTKEERQQELISYEEKLIALRNQLIQLIDSVSNDAPSKGNNEALRQIKTVAEKQLGDYSSMKEKDIKLNRARELVDCYIKMNSLASAVAALPDQREKIQERYQDAVWNPFMATVMNEEVKKRIVAAYRKVLVPHFLKRIGYDISCGNVAELLAKMEGTYERMLELRDEETAKLERKLRREQDPEAVMQLFGLQPFNNDN